MTGPRPLRVAVLGGGIGGLSAALALHQRGFEVAVYEQAPALGEIGAGVFLTPNSIRQLQRLGVGSAVEEYGARIGAGSQYFRHDGTAVAPILTTDSHGWNAVFGMHRADLITILAARLPVEVVHTGRQADAFDQDADGARVSFTDGSVAEADVVVAADGIHSVLQRYVVEPSRPVHSGSVAYRGLVPHERVPAWPTDQSRLWMGEGKHFLVYPVRRGELVNYVGFVPTDAQMKESWSAAGDPVVLAREFAGWDTRVEHLLDQVEVTYRWGLYDREPLSSWTLGRLTLLGDAAHPMLPHLGQGANQSIEDAIALAAVLSRVDAMQVSEALLRYERVRRERTSEIQRGARDNGRRYDSAYDDLGRRDAEIADSVRLRLWLYDYDVLADLELAAR
ncbi:MAG: FAD-dependent oxidoreductase [Nocardioidaceae bacterium]